MLATRLAVKVCKQAPAPLNTQANSWVLISRHLSAAAAAAPKAASAGKTAPRNKTFKIYRWVRVDDFLSNVEESREGGRQAALPGVHH